VTEQSVAERRIDRGLPILWAAFFAGPFAWALNQGAGYAVMKPVCAAAAPFVLWLLAAASFGIVAAGAWIGWRWLRLLQAQASEDGGTAPDRSYFLAILSVALNGLVGVLIAASAIPQFLLSPCE
jgi:hypothetical protein